jgi:hypothetical protein
MHLGNRFVVELHSTQGDFCAIDYVEDQLGSDVVVQGGNHNSWDELVDQMVRGDGPNPAASR